MSYFDGHGVEKNLEQSFKYFKIASDKGLDQAQHNIGIAYQMGYGVNPDLQKAIEHYKLAADQGNSRCSS